ncbi:MAG: MFS transporter [Lachnospiraceae bacterium]|nr:MFS transporter [Lachnospiraceae bacterium]
MKFKLSRQEKAWMLYDVGNSAFILLVTTIMPIYFNYLAGKAGMTSVEALPYWGYAAAVSTILVAFIGPICGTMADIKNYKKRFFILMVGLGALGCVLLGIIPQWFLFLVVFVLAKTGYSASLVFYDSMLTDVTTEERMDRVSSQGFAYGYIGSCIPFCLGLVLVLGADKLGLTMETAMCLTFLLTALWWIVMTIPLLREYEQVHYREEGRVSIGGTFRSLGRILGEMKADKKVFLFMIAFFFYIDGVYTIIDMATSYGEALGIDSTGLLVALLVTQIVAFPCVIIFGKLAGRFRASSLISLCIIAYVGITIFAVLMQTQTHFFILAVCVGMFQGGIQALSRSHFAKIIPPEKSGEYFGILDICGKGASFIGTSLVSLITQITGSAKLGVSVLILLFAVGFFLFRRSTRYLERGNQK